MKQKEENSLPQDKDPSLDTPSEANTTKHINFVDEESNDKQSNAQEKDNATEERQKQWKQGLKEGKDANRSET
jgi:hypothetical protein